jgi:hypothetical protein
MYSEARPRSRGCFGWPGFGRWLVNDNRPTPCDSQKDVITKVLKVLCFDIDSQVFILKGLERGNVCKVDMGWALRKETGSVTRWKANITQHDSITITGCQVLSC